MDNRKYISVLFDDEEPMREGVKKLLDNKETIIDVLTPFPVHGIDRLLSIKRTRIPVGGFIMGVLGAALIFGFMAWVFTVSYPLIIGGKPFFAAPSFIPITFEVTVLFAGVSMTLALFIRSKLKPDYNFKPVEDMITDDMFVILVDGDDGKTTTEKIKSVLSGINFVDVR
jgi:hypothetical protein